MALAAERCERFNDCLHFLKAIIENFMGDLTVEERDLLCATYSRFYVALRSAWKSIIYGTYDAKEDDADLGTNYAELLTDYKTQVEEEVITLCADALNTYGMLIIKAQNCTEHEALVSTVVYLKNSGDYSRFMAQVLGDGVAGQRALEFYKRALQMAETRAKLDSTHPCLLDVALNYSVCLKEIAQDTKQACLLAKEVFDKAIERLDDLQEDTYKDSTLILQLLRDNLSLWAKLSAKPSSSSSSSSVK